MLQKAHKEFYYIKGLSCGAANILKQDALSIGAELAMNANVPNCDVSKTNALLFATKAELKQLIKKESQQPFGLRKLAQSLERFSDHKRDRPKVMGIININNDSFNYLSHTAPNETVNKAQKMIDDGAEFIDIGAVSSRPGSVAVSPQEELGRLKIAIDEIYKTGLYNHAIFSLDSYEPLPIKYALDHGFGFINDITGGVNSEVLSLAREYNAYLCVMHMLGNPLTMQQNPQYDDVVDSVECFFADRVTSAGKAGINKIVLDVGIGFGKTLADNLRLIKAHSHFLHFGFPILIGASCKSIVHDISPAEVSERVAGSIALHLKAVECGASIVRCHNVFEHVQALKVWQAATDII
jgi:dihydropteroate synthase